MATPDIAVIIPVFNESGNVLELADEVTAVAEAAGWNYEVVFIDDASNDDTWTCIGQAHLRNPRVRGLRHTRNAGQSAALWTGFKHTTAKNLATLDGDRQNDPRDLPKLFKLLNDVDFACGFRQTRQDSRVRKISSRLARMARKWVLRSDFQDTGCAVRVFRRECLDAVFAFNGLHRFMPILIAGAGFRTREVAVNHRPRVAGVSKYGVWNRLGRGLVDLFAVAWYLKRQVRPKLTGDRIPSE